MKKILQTPNVDFQISSKKISNNLDTHHTEKNLLLVEKGFNLRVKRSNDDKTFVEATAEGDFTHPLSIDEIKDIVCSIYNNYKNNYKTTKTKNAQFELVDSLAKLKTNLIKFLIKTRMKNKHERTKASLTLIIYQAESKHYTSLVVHFDRGLEQGFYADSLKQAVSVDLQKIFDDQKVELVYLTNHFTQQEQEDNYNSGVWALENAADINRMIDFDQELVWGMNQLNQPHGKKGLYEKRMEFAEKLFSDPVWRASHPGVQVNFDEQKKLLFQLSLDTNAETGEPSAKRFKACRYDVKDLLSIFTESFLTGFSKQLAGFHIRARNEHVNIQTLKSELITGATGGLFGAVVSNSLVGNSMGGTPSLVASVRAFTGIFLVKKQQAQRMTKYFDGLEQGKLSEILCKAAVNIFYSFEYQFMHLIDKAGYQVAMEKLSDDAVDRVMNFLKNQEPDQVVISNELIEKAVLLGPSDKFFKLKPRSFQIHVKGKVFLNEKNEIISSAKLYQKVGLITFDSFHQLNKLYESATNPPKFGYRRLFDWEKDERGDLKQSLRTDYIEELFTQPEYEYVLKPEGLATEVAGILNQIKNRFPPQMAKTSSQKKISKQPIYFDLRDPVADFTGRGEVIKQLHETLLSGRKIAVVSALSALSIATSSGSGVSAQSASSGSQFSISGLGGVGKTQLALQYAKLYAQDYDHNVLWINAETKENLFFSFNKLARKLQLETKDRYGQAKSLEEIVEEVYEYFSEEKSLFILDNVEDYREIEAYLPKSMPGSKPTILITSRYSNWSNVATVFSLNVFTEEETLEFFKKSLEGHSKEEDIKLLNRLLQGLPLALKQAITYINLQESNSQFTIEDYMDCYKEKAQRLLSFNFAAYSNDPYLKTVFTTFMVSLDKIAQLNQGNDAIDLLYMMAYLDPENIPSKLLYILKVIQRAPTKTFYSLELMEDDSKRPYINNLMYLLKSYSLINLGSQSDQYKVHRIMQEVLRISLESDKKKFLEIIGTTQALLRLYGEYKDWNYLHFLLYMSEHREKDEVKSILGYDSIVPFFNFVAEIAERDMTYWRYFLELAYLKYPKKKFLEFLSDALAYSRKEGYCNLVSDILGYLAEQFDQKRMTQNELQRVMSQLLHSKDEYKLVRFSKFPEKRRRQKYAFQLIGEFKIEKLGRLFPEFYACSRRKRSVCLSQQQFEKQKSTAVRSHIEKVSLITHYVGSGLMTKNILSAITRGDWDDVAINFELIVSSEILGKVSNDFFLTPGKKLEAEAQLLKENLGLENRKVWSLLIDKEFSSIGKDLIIARGQELASSFLGRVTGFYILRVVINQIEDYKAGHTELLPEIISNGVMSGTTVTEISLEGLEYLNYIAGIAGKVNPYLEAIAVLVWLGTEIYEAEEQIQAIQKYIHLSSDEKFIEFVRGFLNFSPSEYLQIKLKNTELVRHAIDFLKNHTDFTGYIVPDFSSQGCLYADNGVYLDKERDVTPVETSPDAPQEGSLFCLSGNLTENYQRSYLCQYAMGIQYTQNRTGNVTLINLGAGNDTVLAFTDTPNYFFVGNGEKRYQGGHKGNVFTLDGNATMGQLRGGTELDVLLLEGFHPTSDYLLVDHHGYLCGNLSEKFQAVPLFCPTNDNRLELIDINQIYGRKQQQEIIYLRQAIQFIDGYGGSTSEDPDIFLITQEANPELSLILRKNTLVLFQPDTLNNSTDYRIPAHEMGEATVQLDFKKGIQHRFFFDCTLDDILEMRLENNTLIISVWVEAGIDSGTFTLLISDPYFIREGSLNTNITNFEQNSSYFFQNMEIKLVNNNRLFAQEVTKAKQTLEEYINFFSDLAKYLDRTMTIQLQKNVTLAIGRGNHEIFYVDAVYPTHLRGNGGENVYLIIPPRDVSFPLAEITLYANPSAESDSIEQIDTLDLSEVYKKLKKLCPDADFHLNLLLDEEDLILTLSSHYVKSNQCNKESFGHILTVCLKDGINWYQTLDILLEDKIPKSIVTHDGEEWRLEDMPLLLTENKKIITLTDQDLGGNTEIALLRNSGNYSCFRNDSDLIMTNIHTDPLGACTLVAHDYYRNPVMKQKLLSTRLDFLDEDFYLKDHQSQMDEAQSFSDFVEQLEKPASERQHTSLLIPILSKELTKIRPKRQINSIVSNDDCPIISVGMKMGIGLGIMVSSFLTVRFINKLRISFIENIPLQAIVMTGLSLKQVDAQEQNPSVTETQLDFSNSITIEADCLTAMTPMGWLAVCENKHSIVFLKNHQKSCSFYFERYEMNNTFLQRVGGGVWEANRCETTHNVLSEEIYPLLPKHWQKEFMEKWNQQRAWSNWKYHAGTTVTSMVGDGLLLHTPVGNVFKQLGLAPDWQAREDRYVLSRCGLALEQPLFHLSLAPSTLSLGLISVELALLHPASHRAYRYLSQQGDVAKAKFAVRLLADILQLGVNQVGHLAHVLDYCFPSSHLAKQMSLALRISHYFYFLTGDLSYWHLGLALFFLPKIPQLLDQVGIPASRVMQRGCQQLANVVLGQAILKNFVKDEERQAQADRELARADVCVTQARQRLSSVATASTAFFVANRSNDSCCANDENQKNSSHCNFLNK